MKDMSSVEEFQRQVGLLQSLVRNDSETFSHFVVRVRDAANVLRAYILSTDNQQWAKVLFVAGLQVPIIGTKKGVGWVRALWWRICTDFNQDCPSPPVHL